jgi:hypothetical protein
MKMLSRQEADAFITNQPKDSESEPDDSIVLNAEPSGLKDIMQEIIRNAN